MSSFDPESLSFGLYRYQRNDPETVFSAENINNFVVDKAGTIWLSYDSHVNRIDPERENVLVIHASESLESGDCLGNFGSIAIARNETVWFGSDHGMCRFDPESKKIKRFPPPEPDLLSLDGDPNDYGVGGIREDPEGYLWFSAPLGMNRLDPETGMVRNFLPESEGEQREFGNHIGANLFEEDGKYWFGSTTSLLLLDKNIGEITTYSHDPDDPGSISPGFITATVKHNGYWVGTASGLDRFDPETGRFSPVNDRHGGSLGIVEDIVIDRDDSMWISSSNGLWKMDSLTGELVHFGVSDGIAYRYMGDGQLLDSGEVMFLGGDGFNLFDPAQIKPRERLPEVVVTDFLLNNRSVPISSGDSETQLKQGIDLVSSLDLTWRDRVFAFEFAALEFSDPEKNHLRVPAGRIP